MTLNWRSKQENIELGSGDFIVERTRSEGSIPAGTVVEIEWATGATWVATIDGDTAKWRVEAEQVALIPAGTRFEIWVRYPNSVTETTDDYRWIVGRGVRVPATT